MIKTHEPVYMQSVRYLRGIGPKRALALERVGVSSIRDLLYYFPRRYEDRSQFRSVHDAQGGDPVTLQGEVLSVRFRPLKKTSLVEVTFGDETAMMHAVWFNQPYLKNQFMVGQRVVFYGKVEWYQNRYQMSSPEYEIIDPDEEAIHTGRITPIYPLTEGLFQKSLRAAIHDLIQSQLEIIIQDPLPAAFRAEEGLMSLCEAIHEMHFPSAMENYERARRRIVFDEFFFFELRLLKKLEKMRSKYQSYPFRDGEKLFNSFKEKLPFQLTVSQEKACHDFMADTLENYPMSRLLQGDVGSGKTVIAAFALLMAAKNGSQGVLLVPTEILAEQHYRTLLDLLSTFGVSIGLLTSSTPTNKRAKMLAEIKQGKQDITVGTHAVLQEDVKFGSLALVVIDEQHKFGVYQRCQLLNHHPRPHQLVMTATPIPRTLALTLYGDLSVTTMKELPKGRKEIKTYWITRQKQKQVLEHILARIQQGEQAYFIFPLIEETEKSDLLAAEREYEKLRKGIFSKTKMGLVHGRLVREERDAVMKAFRDREIKILVATSVVEVGVDNPYATVMVIENAERFGLSQLHQMRGRIGRGVKSSTCFLFGEPKTTEGQKRLRILTQTHNGFVIAEEDLKLRGPGDFWGARQSGEPYFRIAHPVLDEEILMHTRQLALQIVRTKALDQNAIWKPVNDYLGSFSLNY